CQMALRAGSLEMKEADEVLRCQHADFLRAHAAQLRDLPRYFFYKCGLVAFTAIRYWRQEWRISFDENAFERNFFGHIPNTLRFRESYVTGERDDKPNLQRRPHMLEASGKTVQYSAQAAQRPMLAQKPQAV